MQRRRRRAFPACAATVLLLAAAPLAASDALQWSVPDLVFESSAALGESAFAVDHAGVVHLFWSLSLGTEPSRQQLLAAAWDGTAWSASSAILESSTAQAPSLAVDPYGELHLIWQGPMAQLQYSRSRAAPALHGAWRDSIAIGDSNVRAQLVADVDGRLHLVYPGRDAAGVFYRASDDGGATWSDPVLIAHTMGLDAAADYVRLVVDGGVIDVVWTEYQLPRAAPALGIFHARSTDGGQSWSPTTPLAGGDAVQANLARLDAQTVHVVWNGTGEHMTGRYHCWTADGGRTWSPVTRVLARGGADGPPQLAVDSAGTLHLLTAQGDGASHLAWDGEGWSAPRCVSCAGGGAGGPVREPRLTIVEGNRLEVVYRVGAGRLWHAWARSAAPRRDPPPVRTIGWGSARFWHRDLKHAPLLIAMVASVVAVRFVRLWRARAARGSV